MADVEAMAQLVVLKPLTAAAYLPAGLLASHYVYQSTRGKTIMSHSIASVCTCCTELQSKGWSVLN